MQTPPRTKIGRLTARKAKSMLRIWYWTGKPHSFGRKKSQWLVAESYRLAGIKPIPFYMRSESA